MLAPVVGPVKSLDTPVVLITEYFPVVSCSKLDKGIFVLIENLLLAGTEEIKWFPLNAALISNIDCDQYQLIKLSLHFLFFYILYFRFYQFDF